VQVALASLPFVPLAPAGPWGPSLVQPMKIKPETAITMIPDKTNMSNFFIFFQISLINAFYVQQTMVQYLAQQKYRS
jgi:hypothetical protein